MKRILPLLAFVLGACGAHAGTFVIAPAPLPLPASGAAPVSASTQAVSGTAGALSSTAEALSPSAAALVPAPTPQPFFFLLPMQDKRLQRQLWRGQSRYLDVGVVAEGMSGTAESWHKHEYQDMSYLWHRQLQAAYAQAEDMHVAAAEGPLNDADAMRQAGAAGAKYVLAGRLEQAQIDRRGHDSFAGTNFSGTDFSFRMKAKVHAVSVETGKALPDLSWEYTQAFFDPTRLGSPDYQTFPGFFSVGLKNAAADFAGQKDLRALAGLPAYTPTPTVTPTPMVTPPTPGPSPTPAPTLEPTPDLGPYWVNPKTGKKVDPSWNFDPEDGTPRKDFILHQPAPTPTPSRRLEQR